MGDTKKAEAVLARRAADAQLLAAEAKAWHWSVTGPTFGELHELFERVAEHARGATDELAERIVQLGGAPPAFPAQWLELSSLDVPAEGGSGVGAERMLTHLLEGLTRISQDLADDIRQIQEEDPATADILVGWLRQVDKDRWMVRAHLA